MSVSIPIVPGFLLCSGIFFIVMANITFYSILGEVNGRRDPKEQISMFFVSVRAFEVMRIHKQLFPASKKRATVYLLETLGFVLGFSIFFFGSK
jgi:hypothetical protein